jgi:tetratricopeptide (TPR) repeat protein
MKLAHTQTCLKGVKSFSRRGFLKLLRWTPAAFLPAPFFEAAARGRLASPNVPGQPSFAGSQIIPHYPARSPLDDVLRLVAPGTDAFVTEKYAAEIEMILRKWAEEIRDGRTAWKFVATSVQSPVESNIAASVEETAQPHAAGVELKTRAFGSPTKLSREQFARALRDSLGPFRSIEAAELEIVSVREVSRAPLVADTQVRYAFAGERRDGGREERIGAAKAVWSRAGDSWLVEKWNLVGETISSAKSPLFVDITGLALGSCDSYKDQLRHGVDYWRTVLDGASGVDVYGNNGVAAGDFDGDGFDDLYVCQPSGLPNRLYRNRGDGTFEDATERAGVDVLDATSCAIFADFENRGLQDLLVVSESGPLLFRNTGAGKFALKRDAFSFAKPPQGTFTHAAVADYDRDGRLDVYFCLYAYYLGLDQYRYPSPYFDARNGPPNFLFHNEGNGRFVDRTEATGLDAENNRFSFACAWGDMDGSGWPNLYVANDFGRSNLYRSNGDGTFTAVSDEAGVNDAGAGMSACWTDFDNDGRQEIYVSNMWSAAGQRISEQEIFHANDPDSVKAAYRRHARGNSFYKNLGNGKFKNVAAAAGVEMGRWAWSSDSWDFDHDGYTDLFVVNGYVSGTQPNELSSFFWRQVVGNSPAAAIPSALYESGWNAINELIRSDHTWSGYERNVLYANNRDGAFSDISGISGLDFLDDSRAFALADLNHDGRLEVVLKNRTAPQIRIIQNIMAGLGDCVSFRLRGVKSNRDAIGAQVTIEAAGLRQTKYLQAGTGFLSQHSKELFFGLGKSPGSISAGVRWPSGLTQTFQNIPANHCVSIVEGQLEVSVRPFSKPAVPATAPAQETHSESLPSSVATWLLEPLPAPEFNLPELSGPERPLALLSGKCAVLYFASSESHAAIEHLKKLQLKQNEFAAQHVEVLWINIEENRDVTQLRALVTKEHLTIPVLLATTEITGVYNLIYRYLFDRRRDLPLPCAFLLDKSLNIVRVYQGSFSPGELLSDARTIPTTYETRIEKALSFPGKLYNGRFQRNDFTYGVALFQHGYLDQAAASFKQVVAAKPDNPEAYYNLGTLYLRKNDIAEAQKFLEKTVSLRPEYPEAWNNLGMIAVQQNRPDDALKSFRQSLALRPDYVTALLNLGNLLRRKGETQGAAELLKRAVALDPDNADANYGLGMLYAHENDLENAEALLRKAIASRPNYADAINNLGVLYVRDGKNVEAEAQFKLCVAIAPVFDQAYLNLARLYVLEKDEPKARETLEALLKLQPEHKLARQALEMLH